MADVIDIPTKGIPEQVTPREIYAIPEPTDRQVWGVCPYLKNLEKCKGCPPWERNDDPAWETDKFKRGCRALAEEACRVVMVAQDKEG